MPVLAKADLAPIKEVLGELSVPPIKGGQGASLDVSFNVLPPFSKDAMKPFLGQVPADNKLRQAVQKARIILWGVSPAAAPADIATEVGEVRQKLRVTV